MSGAPSGLSAVQARISELDGRIARLSGQLPRAAVGATSGVDGASAAGASALAGGPATKGAFADALAAATATAGSAAGPAGGGTGTGAGVVASASKHLGVPYLWGGTDPKKGLDCSGLVQLAMRENGVEVPRTSQQQAKVGTAVASLDQARPGDLIVMSGATHIGIYVGDGKMIHAPKPGDAVKISKVWATPTAIRRVIPETAAPAGGAPAVPPALAAALRLSPAGGSGAAPYQQMFDAATAKHGLPPGLLSAVARTESGYDPGAVSGAGARGLMQIMPGTARGLGVDPMNPAQAVDGAARLLAQHLKTFGSVPLALAAYNAGPGNVQKHGGIPPFAETQSYVRKVTAAQRAA